MIGGTNKTKLQGLVFLHENRVIHGDIHGKIIMMDHGSSQTPAEEGGRVQRNVRYYLVDFTHASIVDGQNDYLFQEDLRDLGLMIDRALGNVSCCFRLYISLLMCSESACRSCRTLS